MKKAPKNDEMTLQPAPQILVTTRDQNGRPNVQAVGYAANVSRNPAMIMIGIEPTRFSYHIIKTTGCFVVNLPLKSFAKEFYYIGTHSGRDEDKFATLKLKWTEGQFVNAPLLTDCPVNIECQVVTSLQPGSNELFIGKVLAVHVDAAYLNADQMIMWDKLDLIASTQSFKKFIK